MPAGTGVSVVDGTSRIQSRAPESRMGLMTHSSAV